MNLERLQQAINIMERAGEVDMTCWSKYVREYVDNDRTEEKYHACGTAACFGGWLAVSPEFLEDGGKAHPITGEPCFDNHLGVDAIIQWLEAEEYAGDTLHLIALGFVETNRNIDLGKPLVKSILGKSTGLAVCGWDNWTAKDVIEALETLKEKYL